MIRERLGRRLDELYRRFLSINQDNWKYYAMFHPSSAKVMRLTSHPIWGPVIRKLYRLEGEGYHTQAHILPINQSLAKSDRLDQSTVMPIQLVREAVERSTYRIILHNCLCRDGFECKDYPVDVGCLMLGEACRRMVATGIAKSVTVEEALAHLDKASLLGLVPICAWVEFEAIAKGISDEDHTNYFEVCFCCPCCCIGLHNYKHMFKNEHMRSVMKSIGWRAQCTEECIGCGKCVDVCPLACISQEGDVISVGETCVGCGLCAVHCPVNAIEMKELVPMKDDLLDYFTGMRPNIT
jgi:ferredoxin